MHLCYNGEDKERESLGADVRHRRSSKFVTAAAAAAERLMMCHQLIWAWSDPVLLKDMFLSPLSLTRVRLSDLMRYYCTSTWSCLAEEERREEKARQDENGTDDATGEARQQ